jgi:hypothetical protein
MKKNTLMISFANFAKLHDKISAFEEKNGPIKIGKKTLSQFMRKTVSIIDDSGDAQPVRTRRRILFAGGDYTSDPAVLRGSLDLKKNLSYGDDEYSSLQGMLDILVREYVDSASVSLSETTACTLVSDVLKMVTTKTTVPK